MFSRNFFAFMFVASITSVGIAQDQLVYPLDVAVGPEDSIYIADRKLPGIWKVVDGKLEIFFQGTKTFRTPLNAIRCVVVDDDGIVYAGDSATREVYSFSEDRKPLPLTQGHIGIAADLLIDGDNLIVSDLETQRIWTFPKVGGKPEEVAVIAAVRGLAKSESGELICVTTLQDPVRKISKQGEIEKLIPGRPFQMTHHCVIVGKNIYIADNYANTIWKAELSPGAKPEAYVSGAPMQKPVGLCQYKEGFLVADPHARQIFVIDKEGKVSPLLSQTESQ
ncbi:hypothetical protein [Thalassoglobus sp.]|uniref:hypothetical protein n=1 Tax=Thalassoglobus sp. TaxID=2795869 RepID=UPI003AA96ECF